MIETINEKLNIRALLFDNDPNTYYLSYQGQTKCIINIKLDNNDITIFPRIQGDCTAEELTEIISSFSDFILKKHPDANGIIFATDPNEWLENIGFKSAGDNSEYLYKENKRVNKVR